jgi:N-acetylglucosamine kinase-like BadF-type ATPase
VVHVAGVDAGGTKSLALLADEGGELLARARGGGANLHTHGEQGVERVLRALLGELSAVQPIDALCVGMAGVDTPRDAELVRGVLGRLGYTGRVRIVNDALIALVAGSGERHGIVVLSGTGSIAYGLDAGGRSARSGGYGNLLADEGSAYWLGHQALRAAVRASDGRGPATLLLGSVLAALRVGSVSELAERVYRDSGLPKHEIAQLASLVEDASRAGDAVAAELIARAAAELALAAASVARQLGFGQAPLPVVLAGGTFKACPSLVDATRRALDVPGARATLLETEPAQGALTLALELVR